MSATMEKIACVFKGCETDPYAKDRSCYDPNGAEKDDAKKQTKEVHLTVVVVGASGDLAKKKTFPALASLFSRGGFLPDSYNAIGYARSDYDDQSIREKIREGLEGDEDTQDNFLERLTYQRGQYDEPEGYRELHKTMSERESKASGPVARLFYLAVPPTTYESVLSQIKAECSEFDTQCPEDSWLRVVIEKPFGKDLESAEQLSSHIGGLFGEEQVYRIDHFLGKELAQNLLVMRFANTFLGAVWHREQIDNIQITMKEPFGTEGRGGYFDEFGIIRDVIQNHLLQVLALLTMERPVAMHPDDIRDEKTKVIRSMRVVSADDVVLGQYVGAGDKPGYKDDEGVPADSQTPTYAVVRMWIDNERWEGVPILIKAGKALDAKKVEIRVQFKTQPGYFGENASEMRNEFVMRIQPDEAMYMKMVVKKPGLGLDFVMSELNLTYKERYSTYIPQAYERLILDVIEGNQQHYVRRDELRASWALFTPLLHAIDDNNGPPLQEYAYGSRGVPDGDQMIQDSGYQRTKSYNWSKQEKQGFGDEAAPTVEKA